MSNTSKLPPFTISASSQHPPPPAGLGDILHLYTFHGCTNGAEDPRQTYFYVEDSDAENPQKQPYQPIPEGPGVLLPALHRVKLTYPAAVELHVALTKFLRAHEERKGKK